MSDDTVPSWVEKLRDSGILEARQLAEVTSTLHECFLDADGLAQELLRRGWLTAYQIDRLHGAKGADLVLGDYVLLDLLGEGGMGQVFKARHRVMHRIVALKVIRKDRLINESAVNRFHQEIRSAAKLLHPNIIIAHDARTVGDTHFFVMEYVEGTDLARLVREKGPLAAERAGDYIVQAALGLQHAHEQQLIHRDIKPSNLLLSNQGVVKLLDMGLARINLDDGDEHTPLTETGAVMGTPDFMSPEQARDSRAVDIRSDIYSLGCTLYFLLSGQSPVAGGSMLEKLYRHAHEDPMPVDRVAPGVPCGLALVVRKMLAKRPDDRYQSPADVAEALAHFCPAAVEGSRSRSAAVAYHNVSGREATASRSTLGSTAPPTPSPPVQTGADTHDEPNTLPFNPVGTTTVPAPVARSRPGYAGLMLKAGAAGVIALGIALGTVWYGRKGAPATAPSATASNGIVQQVPAADVARTTKQSSRTGDPNPPRRPTAVPLPPEKLPLPGEWWESVTVLLKSSGGAGVIASLPVRLVDPKALEALAKALRAVVKPGPPRVFAEPGPKPGLLFQLTGHHKSVTSVAIAPDGKLALSSGKDGLLRFWDLEKGGATRPPFGIRQGDDRYPLLIWSVAFSADGQYAVSGSGGFYDPRYPGDIKEGEDHFVTVWPVRTWEEIPLEPRERHLSKIVRCVTISADGKWVLSAGEDNQIRLWDVDARRQVRAFRATSPLQRVQGVALSRDGKQAVSVDHGVVRLWDVATGDELRRFEWHDRFHPAVLTSVAFLPTNRLVVFGARDSKPNLIVWDTMAENEAIFLPGHKGGTVCVAVTPDGRVLSGGADGEIALWSIAANKPICSFAEPKHPGELTCLAVAPDGRRAISGRADGSMAVWILPPAQQ
jgi:serine/threonine-protein kinase